MQKVKRDGRQTFPYETIHVIIDKTVEIQLLLLPALCHRSPHNLLAAKVIVQGRA